MGLNEKFFKTSAADTPNFAPILYTGNWNGSNTNTIEVGFRPDWIWIKRKDGADSHHLYDSVRGMGKALYSNTTDPENASNHLNTTSTGFTLVTDNVNQNNSLFIAWCWKAGGAAVLNQEGTRDTQVSANVDAGFSVFTASTNNTNGFLTYGTGLSQPPDLVIYKRTNGSGAWSVASPLLTDYQYLVLNDSAAVATLGQTIHSYSNTTFGIRNSYQTSNGYDLVFYAFHSVNGYQKIGKYTGNGNNAGTIVNTGFTPSYLMIKSVNTNDNGGGAWIIYDNARSTSNPRAKRLFANFDAQEATNVNYNLDFLTGSTKGFQPLNGASGGWGFNTLNVDYIYLAIA